METTRARSAVLSIGVGGFAAGSLDLLQACLLFGRKVTLLVAGGVLGRSALHGGLAIAALGVLLHFSIATLFAAVYYGASRRLRFLITHPLVCGLIFGCLVDLTMTLIVMPMSALHAKGPFSLHDLLQGLLAHMVLVGLPISYSASIFRNVLESHSEPSGKPSST